MQKDKKFSPQDRVEYFTRQLEDIQQAMGVLKKFEELTQRWLKKARGGRQQ
jgi:hypothetical protein